MRRPCRGALASTLALLSLFLGEAPPASAAELGSSGGLEPGSDSLAWVGFESASDRLGALGSPVHDPVEGERALAVEAGKTVVVSDQALFESVAQKRVVITVWGLAEGAEPALELVYGTPGKPAVARIDALRTGRETSDGWAEYSSGPVDGSIWGQKLRSLVLWARAGSAGKGRARLDGLEVSLAPGSPVSPTRCTQADVDATCGASGECLHGHCVDAAAVWGPLPPSPEHRRELVDRWAFLASRSLADRKAAARAVGFGERARALLAGEVGPRKLYGGLSALVAGLRDAHTELGAPPSESTPFFPYAARNSGSLGACFGLVSDDLSGQGQPAYAVYHATPGGQLRRGDVLRRIDGIDAGAWVARAHARFSRNLPNDPSADGSRVGVELASLLSLRASEIVLARCEGKGRCAELPPLRPGDAAFESLSSGNTPPRPPLACTTRLSGSRAEGDADQPLVEQGPGGTVRVQFDGFSPRDEERWRQSMARAFSPQARVLVDARLGHGGEMRLGSYLFRLLRGKSEPQAMFVMPRATVDEPDAPWLFDPSWDRCADPRNHFTFPCGWTGGWSAVTDEPRPAGASSTIAWVNALDASLSDIVPRLLRGRSNVRVFAPHPSEGAFGQRCPVPPIVSTWTPGSIQSLDARFGASPAEARLASWESGRGVEPDEIVTQSASDLLEGRDTVLEAATAWLLRAPVSAR